MNRFAKKKIVFSDCRVVKFNPFDILGQFHGFTLINVTQDLFKKKKRKKINKHWFYSTESGSSLEWLNPISCQYWTPYSFQGIPHTINSSVLSMPTTNKREKKNRLATKKKNRSLFFSKIANQQVKRIIIFIVPADGHKPKEKRGTWRECRMSQ